MTTQYSIGDLNRDEWLSLLGIASADDPKLAALAALSWGGGALKVLRVNATENGWELAAIVAEPPIAAGTSGQYWRGDKSWQTLDKVAVGLGNVNNTSDADKPVSTAQQTALDLKANLAGPTFNGAVTADGFKMGLGEDVVWGGGYGANDPLIAGNIATLYFYPAGASLVPSTLSGAGFALGVGGIKPATYTVASVPSAATLGAGSIIYVSDEGGGGVPAFSDGSNWRRVTDRAVIS